MIASAKSARFFQRQDIGWLFDDTELVGCARGILANLANFLRGEISAECARMNGLPCGRDGARDLLGLISARLHNPKRNPFRRARSNAGHLPQLGNQIPERGRVFGLSQNARWFTRRVFPSSAERAVQAGADTIAAAHHPLYPGRALFGIPKSARPSVFLDKARPRSRKSRAGRDAPAWLQSPAKVARKFHAAPACLLH